MEEDRLFMQLFRTARDFLFKDEILLVVSDDQLRVLYGMAEITHEQMMNFTGLPLFINNMIITHIEGDQVLTHAYNYYKYDAQNKEIDEIPFKEIGPLDEGIKYHFEGILISDDMNIKKIGQDQWVNPHAVTIVDFTSSALYIFTENKKENLVAKENRGEIFIDEVPKNVGFGNVFSKMEEFAKTMTIQDLSSVKRGAETAITPTTEGVETPSLMRFWENGRRDGKSGERLEYWWSESKFFHGYAIIYADDEEYLIVGSGDSHAFVLTKQFQFYSSHGEANDMMEPQFDLDNLVMMAIINAKNHVIIED